ncbi:MAG: hypothetical protein H0V17_32825 [Deltaproteobacteria bacterium]|nr:hypothetical protein [Deltaproteobacteria bacterium]
MREIAITPIHAGGPAFGYLGSIVVDEPTKRVWAVGGTHHKPTILYSADRGHTFERWESPTRMPGIRDVHVEGDMVWVVGEWGAVASTQNGGTDWRAIKPAGMECLYSIMRGTDRRLWVLGDNGMVLRSRSAKPNAQKFERVENKSTARMLYMYVEGNTTWLLDSAGGCSATPAEGSKRSRSRRCARPGRCVRWCGPRRRR